jgi:hypothetical protein
MPHVIEITNLTKISKLSMRSLNSKHLGAAAVAKLAALAVNNDSALCRGICVRNIISSASERVEQACTRMRGSKSTAMHGIIITQHRRGTNRRARPRMWQKLWRGISTASGIIRPLGSHIKRINEMKLDSASFGLEEKWRRK